MNFVERFLTALQDSAPLLVEGARYGIESSPEFAGKLMGWASSVLGEDWDKTLARGYVAFVLDVTRSQMRYERSERYQFSSFSDAAEAVYFNPEFQEHYHWGVFSSTFAWKHHARIAHFFQTEFLSMVAQKGLLGDFGAGSGLWSCLFAERQVAWDVQAIDISPYSVAMAGALVSASELESQITVLERDISSDEAFGNTLFDAAISCFVLEHLENPSRFLTDIIKRLPSDAPVFFTTAITAAESDHIFEFRSEAEVVQLLEDTGFRMTSVLSLGPDDYPRQMKFLPRSIAVCARVKSGTYY